MKKIVLLLTMVALFVPQRVNAQEEQEDTLTQGDIVEINNNVEKLSGNALHSYVKTLLEIEDPTAYDEKTLELSIDAIQDENGYLAIQDRNNYIKKDLADDLLGLLDEADYSDALISESREVIEDEHENKEAAIHTTWNVVFAVMFIVAVLINILLVCYMKISSGN